ncbi:uncharacterized protein BJ171DRAFT_307804 [Polychytrium aggregatum]|uniref:uncharacterized protein n=1 Tax=Polychytrium aggregatum TaxID=110093 RepID=UPI0022FF05E5|nr:uncharacterized protein BJ171DRAFT_307804 [Polychytrium aggregatum]KAI9206860.1 hypothetical protein BJ171DRAFT_307804 [Polychytrium aggregatum]
MLLISVPIRGMLRYLQLEPKAICTVHTLTLDASARLAELSTALHQNIKDFMTRFKDIETLEWSVLRMALAVFCKRELEHGDLVDCPELLARLHEIFTAHLPPRVSPGWLVQLPVRSFDPAILLWLWRISAKSWCFENSAKRATWSLLQSCWSSSTALTPTHEEIVHVLTHNVDGIRVTMSILAGIRPVDEHDRAFRILVWFVRIYIRTNVDPQAKVDILATVAVQLHELLSSEPPIPWLCDLTCLMAKVANSLCTNGHTLWRQASNRLRPSVLCEAATRQLSLILRIEGTSTRSESKWTIQPVQPSPLRLLSILNHLTVLVGLDDSGNIGVAVCRHAVLLEYLQKTFFVDDAEQTLGIEVGDSSSALSAGRYALSTFQAATAVLFAALMSRSREVRHMRSRSESNLHSIQPGPEPVGPSCRSTPELIMQCFDSPWRCCSRQLP